MPVIPSFRSVSFSPALPAFGQGRKERVNHAKNKALYLEHLVDVIQNGPHQQALDAFLNLPLHPELHDVASHLAHLPEDQTKNLFHFLLAIAGSVTPAQRAYYADLYDMRQRNPEQMFTGAERRKSKRNEMEADALFLLSRPAALIDKQLSNEDAPPRAWVTKLSRMEPEHLAGLLLALHYEMVPETARKHDQGSQQRRRRRVFGR